MQPEVVRRNWDQFAVLIEQALPPITTKDEFQRSSLLKAITSRSLRCWVAVKASEDGIYNRASEGILGMMTATVGIDPISNSKVLIVYTLTYVESMSHEIIHEGMKYLIQVAKDAGCGKLIAYTRLETIRNLVVNKLGWTSHYVLEKEV